MQHEVAPLKFSKCLDSLPADYRIVSGYLPLLLLRPSRLPVDGRRLFLALSRKFATRQCQRQALAGLAEGEMNDRGFSPRAGHHDASCTLLPDQHHQARSIGFDGEAVPERHGAGRVEDHLGNA